MANTLIDVQATFLALDAEYHMLLVVCQTEEQRDALAAQYSAARQNYQNSLEATLADDDPQVAALAMQLKAANTLVVQSIEQLGDIARVIANIANAVSLGANVMAVTAPSGYIPQPVQTKGPKSPSGTR